MVRGAFLEPLCLTFHLDRRLTLRRQIVKVAQIAIVNRRAGFSTFNPLDLVRLALRGEIARFALVPPVINAFGLQLVQRGGVDAFGPIDQRVALDLVIVDVKSRHVGIIRTIDVQHHRSLRLNRMHARHQRHCKHDLPMVRRFGTVQANAWVDGFDLKQYRLGPQPHDPVRRSGEFVDLVNDRDLVLASRAKRQTQPRPAVFGKLGAIKHARDPFLARVATCKHAPCVRPLVLDLHRATLHHVELPHLAQPDLAGANVQLASVGPVFGLVSVEIDQLGHKCCWVIHRLMPPSRLVSVGWLRPNRRQRGNHRLRPLR